MRFESYQQNFSSLRYGMLRQRAQYYEIQDEEEQNLKQLRTSLQKTSLQSYQIYSKLADNQILLALNSQIKALVLQNILQILQDFNDQKSEYQDGKKFSNFLIFSNRLLASLDFCDKYQSNSKSKQKFQKYELFLATLLKTTNSFKIVEAILDYCVKSGLGGQHKKSSVIKELRKLLKHFSSYQNSQKSQLNNVKKLINQLNQEGLLIFQIYIEKFLKNRYVQTVKKSKQILQFKAYHKLFKQLYKELSNKQKVQIIRQFECFSIDECQRNHRITFKPKFLHKDLMNHENMLFVIEQSRQIFLNNIPQVLGKIEEDKIICCFSQEVIMNILKVVKKMKPESSVDSSTIQKFCSLLKLLLTNSGKTLKLAHIDSKKETKEEFTTKKYFCSVFQVFASLFIQNVKKDQEIANFLPISFYEQILSEILTIMKNEQSKQIIEESCIKYIVELQIFFTEKQSLTSSSESFGHCVMKIMQILVLYTGKIENKKNADNYFRLLNYLAIKSMPMEGENKQLSNQFSNASLFELNKVVQQFLNCYYTDQIIGSQIRSRERILQMRSNERERVIPLIRNPKTQQVLTAYVKQELKGLLRQKQQGSLKKLAGHQLENKQQQIKNKIKSLIPLMKFKEEENPESRELSANIFSYFYLELPYICQTNLHKLRTWICSFETKQQQRSKNFLETFVTTQKLMEALTQTLKSWDYKAWTYPIKQYQNKETTNTFKLFIINCKKMIKILSLKTAVYEYLEKHLPKLIEFILNLRYILHEAQHKCFHYLRRLSQEEFQYQKQKGKKKQICEQTSFYSELFKVQNKLIYTLSFLINCCKRTLSLKEQRCLFKYLGVMLRNTLRNQQQVSKTGEMPYYQSNLKTIKVGIIASTINKLLQKSRTKRMNGFPCQQIYQIPRNVELDSDEIQQYPQKMDITAFSCIYSEIKDSFNLVCKQIINSKIKYLNEYKRLMNEVEKGEVSNIIYMEIYGDQQFFRIKNEKYQNQEWRKKTQDERTKYLQTFSNQFTRQLLRLISKLVIQNLNMSGPCQFNGIYHQKSTPQMGRVLMYHQMHSILNEQDSEFFINIKISSLLKTYKTRIPSSKTGEIVSQVLNSEQQPEIARQEQYLKINGLSHQKLIEKMQKQISTVFNFWIQKIKEKNTDWKFYEIVTMMLKNLKLNKEEMENKQVIIFQQFFEGFKNILGRNRQQIEKQLIYFCKILNGQFMRGKNGVMSTFFQEGIGYHILNFICSQKWKDRQPLIQNLIQNLLNYLPSPKDQLYQKQIILYVSSICSMLQTTSFKSNKICKIILAMSIIQEKPQIQERLKSTYIKLLRQNRLYMAILTIYSRLNKDNEFIKASIEHTIKMFIKECRPKSANGNHKFTIKQIQKYLQKYQKYDCFKQVCHRFLKRTEYGYLFFSEKEHNLSVCEISNIKFIHYQPSILQKHIVDSLLALMVQENLQSNQKNSYLPSDFSLFELLQAQKLLIPYFLSRKIKIRCQKGKQFNEDQEIIYDPISWMMFQSCKYRTNKYFSLLQFLLLNNGFCIDKNYQLSDYTSALLIKNLPIFRPENINYTDSFRQEAQKWTMLFIYSFMKIKNFFKYFQFDSNTNLLMFIEDKLKHKIERDKQNQQKQIQNPVLFVFAQKIYAAYLHNRYTNELIKKKLYQINRNEKENQIDCQYLQMDVMFDNRSQQIQQFQEQNRLIQMQQRAIQRFRRTRNYELVPSNDNEEREQYNFPIFRRFRQKRQKEVTLLEPVQNMIDQTVEKQQKKSGTLESIIKAVQQTLPQSAYLKIHQKQEMEKQIKFQIRLFQIDTKNQRLRDYLDKKQTSFKLDLRNNYTPKKVKKFNKSVKKMMKLIQKNKMGMFMGQQDDIEHQSLLRRAQRTNNHILNTQQSRAIWDSILSQLNKTQSKIQIIQKCQQRKTRKSKTKQILWQLGKPQNLLQQNGINQQEFQSLNADEQIQLIQKISYEKASPEKKAQIKNIPLNFRVFPADMRPVQIQKNNQEKQYEQVQKIKTQIVHPSISSDCFVDVNDSIIDNVIQSFYIQNVDDQINCFKQLLKNNKVQKRAIVSFLMKLRQIKEGNEQKIQIAMIKNEKKQNNEKNVSIWRSQKVDRDVIIVRMLTLFKTQIKSEMKIWDYLFEQVQIEQDIPYHPITHIKPNKFIPALQLIDISFEYLPDVAVKLMSRVQNIPKVFKEKLIELFKKQDSWKKASFKDLDNLSNDQEMKKLFEEAFPEEQPPNIKILGHLMNYNFTRIPYLKRLHKKVLKDCKPEAYQFLNKVLSLYSQQQLIELRPFIEKHNGKYKLILKWLQKSGRNIKKQPINKINNQIALSFKEKIRFFYSHPQIQLTNNIIYLKVRRDKIFEQSFEQIMRLSSQQLKGRLSVRFIIESGQQEALDIGGPTNEWFKKISEAIIDPKFKLFTVSSSQQVYTPDPLCTSNKKALQMYIFIGRVIGLALRHKGNITQFFTQTFYKYLLNIPIEVKDLEQNERQLYSNLLKLLEMENVKNLELNFAYCVKVQNQYIQRQLVQGGKNIEVTEKNKREYVEKYALCKMKGNMYLQMRHIIQGLNEVVPLELLSDFTVNDFQLLLAGMPKFTIQDLKKRVRYQGYSEDDQIIKWIWEILEKYSQEQLVHFVQFVTGKGNISIVQEKNIIFTRYPNSDSILRSHTCFNQLDLFEYESKEKLQQKLNVVVKYGYEGFGFG